VNRLLSSVAALSALLALLALVAGCGLGAMPAPEQVVTPSVEGPHPVPDGTARVRVYFVRDGRLAPVLRRAGPSPQAAVTLLATGPTRTESDDGLRSMLGPGPVLVTGPTAGTLTVDLGPGFELLPGRERLLAAAQLVWTLTEVPGVERAHLRVEGRLIAVPADGGAVRRPLRREDFRSVAPV
jgi:hypothetical protein